MNLHDLGDTLFWVGAITMLIGALGLRDRRKDPHGFTLADVAYLVGILMVAGAAIAYKRDPQSYGVCALLTCIGIAYVFAPLVLARWKERKHARKEVHEGQVDGGGPEEAQGREEQ